MAKRPTIVDVARLAGVSLGTASQALNKKKGVASQTVLKVLEAAEMLNYYPSLSARQLREQASNLISLYIPIPVERRIHHSTWSFYFPIIQGFMEELQMNDYRIHLEFIEMKELADHSQLTAHALGYHIQSVAFILPYKGDFSGIIKLKDIGTNVVTIYAEIGESISSVCINNLTAAKNAVIWLGSLGHTQIGFIGGEETHFAAIERKKGYLAGIQGICDQNMYVGDWTIRSGIEGFKYFIEKQRTPTAVFCANDHMAIGVLKACTELGIHTPREISIVGFDDNFICQVSDPQLTSVIMPLFKMGREAARTLFSMHKKNTTHIEHKILKSQLIIRDSTASYESVNAVSQLPENGA